MIAQLEQFIKRIEGKFSYFRDFPLATLTTYGVGGTADLLLRPRNSQEIANIIQEATNHALPFFVLGGGANILISDRGIRGIVIDMGMLNDFQISNAILECGAGLAVSSAAQRCAELGYAGLHFLYSMPGSLGGAVWMNARCYGQAVDSTLQSVSIVNRAGEEGCYYPTPTEYGYKRSPFQHNGAIITAARFQLQPRSPNEIIEEMLTYRADRARKGHFAAPSAGSVFKNNRQWGAPSGAIIDQLDLRGHQIGGARISDRHANIIINNGGATAQDIRRLTEFVAQQVYNHYGYQFEREVLYVGDWEDASEE